jgi:hypothetical protein
MHIKARAPPPVTQLSSDHHHYTGFAGDRAYIRGICFEDLLPGLRHHYRHTRG